MLLCIGAACFLFSDSWLLAVAPERECVSMTARVEKSQSLVCGGGGKEGRVTSWCVVGGLRGRGRGAPAGRQCLNPNCLGS